MIAADAERHALGGAAGEFRMQQCVELLAVAGGKRGVERAGEIGGGGFSIPMILPSEFAVLAAERENSLEAANAGAIIRTVSRIIFSPSRRSPQESPGQPRKMQWEMQR